MSLNRAMVIGNLGGDPVLRNLPSGQPAVWFSIATDESFTDKQGEKQGRVEWHHIVAFGKLAETCNLYLKKGRQVYVEGRLRTREFEAKSNGGGKRQRTEIVASRVQFLGVPPKTTQKPVLLKSQWHQPKKRPSEPRAAAVRSTYTALRTTFRTGIESSNPLRSASESATPGRSRYAAAGRLSNYVAKRVEFPPCR